MQSTEEKFNESDKAGIVRKINEGLSVIKACELYTVDQKSIQSWLIQFPGGQVSFAERIRLLELQVAQLTNTVLELKKSKAT